MPRIVAVTMLLTASLGTSQALIALCSTALVAVELPR
jgi:hypothetical protein